jgi:hypothetical protein
VSGDEGEGACWALGWVVDPLLGGGWGEEGLAVDLGWEPEGVQLAEGGDPVAFLGC